MCCGEVVGLPVTRGHSVDMSQRSARSTYGRARAVRDWNWQLWPYVGGCQANAELLRASKAGDQPSMT